MKPLKVLCIYSFLFFFSSFLHAQTYVSGNISEDTQWPKAESPYIVTGSITVLNEVTLTINLVLNLNLMVHVHLI